MGTVVGGSISRGVEVRLDSSFAVEAVKVGGFVTIEGRERRFFGIVSDVALETSDGAVRASPPEASDPFVPDNRLPEQINDPECQSTPDERRCVYGEFL